MPRDWRELDEDELRELEKAEHEIPRGWRPNPETLRAIEGEARTPEKAREVLPSVTDTSDLEETRLDTAAEGLKQIEWLKPEAWSQLDEYQRRVALDLAGRELSEAYHHPKPPVMISDQGDETTLGVYDDSDYGIFMNRAGEANNEKLLGDDPELALRTYAHEWRHSYQWEQATRWEKPQFMRLIDDPDQAMQWSENIRNYKEPDEDYDAYRNQSVERDARNFADKLVRRVYR